MFIFKKYFNLQWNKDIKILFSENDAELLIIFPKPRVQYLYVVLCVLVITLWLILRKELHYTSKITNCSEFYYNYKYVWYFQNPTSFQVAFKWQVHWVKLELLNVLQNCAQWHIGITLNLCVILKQDFKQSSANVQC